MKKAVVVILVSMLAFMVVNIAAAGPIMDRILQKGELEVGTT